MEGKELVFLPESVYRDELIATFFRLDCVIAVGTLSVVEGIRCYQCGTYIITSVTPCRNLSSTHLHECPPEAQFCSKYSNPAIQVYGCEKHCEERGKDIVNAMLL